MAELHQIFCTYCLWSILLWQCCCMLYTSGFFSMCRYRGPSGGVSPTASSGYDGKVTAVCALANALLRVLAVSCPRRQRSPRLDEFIVQGVPGWSDCHVVCCA